MYLTLHSEMRRFVLYVFNEGNHKFVLILLFKCSRSKVIVPLCIDFCSIMFRWPVNWRVYPNQTLHKHNYTKVLSYRFCGGLGWSSGKHFSIHCKGYASYNLIWSLLWSSSTLVIFVILPMSYILGYNKHQNILWITYTIALPCSEVQPNLNFN